MSERKWKVLRRIVCVVMLLSMLPLTGLAAENTGMDVFRLPDPLPEAPFTDTKPGSWYEESVQIVYALELMDGTGGNRFTPEGTVPLTQAITVAVRIYEKYYGVLDTSEGYGQPWYSYYVARAEQYGILPQSLQGKNLTRPATRAELAAILAKALPESELTAVNRVDTLPDYDDSAEFWDGVLLLYRAGVIIGDDRGLFLPTKNTRRSELAAMLCRLVCPEKRIVVNPVEPTDPTEPEEPTEPDVPDAPEMDAFRLPDPLPELPFTDVAEGKWYYEPVRTVYALALMAGVEDNRFSPDGQVLISQMATVAVRIYQQYHGLTDQSYTYEGKPWYQYYMDSAKTYGLLPDDLLDANPNRAATREEVAAILARALPTRELNLINQVTELPDYQPGDRYWAAVATLYRAGVLRGDDEYGTFRPESRVRRSELATMLCRLVRPESREKFTLKAYLRQTKETIVYGKSGAGRDLTAYRFGNGKNVMILTFAIHGWEDNFDRDGQMLVDTGNRLRQTLAEQYETLIRPGDWSVYVIPCVNPDGLYDGWTCNGPGRCTTYYLDENGKNTYGKGIDMNRCFPYHFSASWSNRYYTGSQPLAAREARALADFVRSVKGSGYNILIDAHGWYRQTIVSGGYSGDIFQTFQDYFPGNSYTSLSGASGYLASWAAYVENFDACLFEFPSVSSAGDFRSKGYAQDYINAISALLKTYDGA